LSRYKALKAPTPFSAAPGLIARVTGTFAPLPGEYYHFYDGLISIFTFVVIYGIV